MNPKSSQETISKIENELLNIDGVICRHIENSDLLGRGAVSQDILSQLRNFVEHTMLRIYADSANIKFDYEYITEGIKFVKSQGKLKFLRKFHEYLQIVASHYTLDSENSERVMLKYYEYLLKIKNFMFKKYSLNILENLNKFPLDLDKNTQEYYEKIAEKVDTDSNNSTNNDRYYVHKIKPFFVNQRIYYEVTFIPVKGSANKSDRTIAFTTLDLSKNYAVKLWTYESDIQILGKTMPILIIKKWEVSIRACEVENFAKIFGVILKQANNLGEYRGLMDFLTQTGFNLVELLDFDDRRYQEIRAKILLRYNAKISPIFDIFDKCREIIKDNKNGCNVLQYLLYHLNNKIIKSQYYYQTKNYFSDLYLKFGCIPFDKMPFNSSLVSHNPKLLELYDCIDSKDRKHEILARLIRNNTENNGQLYTPISQLDNFKDIDDLISIYNSKLYRTHQGRRIEKHNKHLYIQDYENDTIKIIQELMELSDEGVQNYESYVNDWLNSNMHPVDCDEKKAVLQKLFSESKVSLIYGSAGTGKTTLINHISHLFSAQSKLYLANTNPAVNNLKRKINTSDCEFMTIAKFLKNKDIETNYNILVIDECSTVNNRDMKQILEKASFDLLILVGDIYQIESIQFGNWFSAAKEFIPKQSVYELVKPYRSNNKKLQLLWDRVRKMDDTILELDAREKYSISLDSSIFEVSKNDEVILCLNYDGLYGINNINRFLQQVNPNPATVWGVHQYKVGDPILFNDSRRFAPLIYNNLKGWIVGIEIFDDKIQFDIEVDKIINGLEAEGISFELLENSISGNSVIRFSVNKYKNTDEDDDDYKPSDEAPFQIAYAVSIHKAQGLEYSSVKLVVADEIEDMITHSIFYTAITRARDTLKIYWTPETEIKILKSIKPVDNSKDVALLRQGMIKE